MRVSRTILVLVATSYLELCQAENDRTQPCSTSTLAAREKRRIFFGDLTTSTSSVTEATSTSSGTETTSTSSVVSTRTTISSYSSSTVDPSPTDVLAHIAPCAAACFRNLASDSKCADNICSCVDEDHDRDVDACLLSSCDLSDAVDAKNVTGIACNRPHRDKVSPYITTNLVMAIVTGVFIFTRIVFNKFFSHHRRLRADDYLLIVAFAIGLPCIIINRRGLIANGLGRDVWTLSLDTLANFSLFFYVQQTLYVFLSAAIKLTLLLFYLSIFPGSITRRLLWLTVVGTIVYGLTFILFAALQCTPIDFYWVQYKSDIDGHCLNLNLLGWINGAISVAIDVWMIGIPLFQLRKLELHWKKKIGVGIMFLTGAFVTVVSGLRLQSLIYFASTVNPTWDQWTVAWWSTIELNVGFICTCLPTFRLVLVRLWPRVFGRPNDESATARSRQPQSQKNLVSVTHGKSESVDIEMQQTIPTDYIDPSEVGIAL